MSRSSKVEARLCSNRNASDVQVHSETPCAAYLSDMPPTRIAGEMSLKPSSRSSVEYSRRKVSNKLVTSCDCHKKPSLKKTIKNQTVFTGLTQTDTRRRQTHTHLNSRWRVLIFRVQLMSLEYNRQVSSMMSFGSRCTLLPSSDENANRKNKKHTQRKKQRAKRTLNHSRCTGTSR